MWKNGETWREENSPIIKEKHSLSQLKNETNKKKKMEKGQAALEKSCQANECGFYSQSVLVNDVLDENVE